MLSERAQTGGCWGGTAGRTRPRGQAPVTPWQRLQPGSHSESAERVRSTRASGTLLHLHPVVLLVLGSWVGSQGRSHRERPACPPGPRCPPAASLSAPVKGRGSCHRPRGLAQHSKHQSHRGGVSPSLLVPTSRRWAAGKSRKGGPSTQLYVPVSSPLPLGSRRHQ